jgi:hypothetical protein
MPRDLPLPLRRGTLGIHVPAVYRCDWRIIDAVNPKVFAVISERFDDSG